MASLLKKTTCDIGEEDEEVCLEHKTSNLSGSKMPWHRDGKLFCEGCGKGVSSVSVVIEGAFCDTCIIGVMNKRIIKNKK
jgi:hypothetical protein